MGVEMEKSLKLKLVTSAILAALAQMSTASAEEAVATAEAVAVETAAAVAADNSPLNLDKIVVTGSAKKISKMKSSVSISTLNSEQVQNTGATNSAEVLRNVPGFRSESSGGESNVNLTSRGLPISAGGARWVQLQEDGLPILQFGDLDFATPDTWLRIDQGLDKLEVIRGGSASTLATSAPGGIVNFISQTGEKEGGKIGLSTGLNYNEWRTDFSYGASISNDLRGFVSGFYRRGEGFRDAGTTMEAGGQIKGNITKQLDNGYFRVNFKHLDDKTPANLRVPTVNNGNSISEAAGIDPRTVSFYGINFPSDIARTRGNGLSSTSVTDGVQAKTDSLGFEFEYDFNGWNVSDKFRWSDNSGSWMGVHSASGLTGNTFTAVLFNTQLHDLGNTINDLKVSKDFSLGEAGKLTPTVGLYTSWQNVAQTWSFNAYTVDLANRSAVLLNNSTQQWGNCCTRDFDVEYKTISPYAALAWEIDKWNFDASIRQDNQSAKGYYVKGTQTAALLPSGTFDAVNRENVNYDINHTSYSLGANYRINTNLAVFARASNGVAFNGDRILFPTANNLNNGGQRVAINEADQYELGAKWRSGNFNSFITLFQAKVDESNFDLSINKSSVASYDNKGVEAEMGYSLGDFKIGGGFTYTDAKTLNVAAGASDKVQRQAKWVYQMTPTYRYNDKLTLVGNLVGTTASRDSGTDNLLPAFAVVNAGIRYDYDKHVQLSLSANNLFDKIGYTEADGNTARSVDGRSVKAAVVYSF